MTQSETFLDRIIGYKREEIARRIAAVPFSDLRDRLTQAPPARSFAQAIRGDSMRLIAEIKKASPSKGALRPDLDPVQMGKTYQRGGAAAISVLTDKKHFQGSLTDLECLRRSLPDGPPLLRKDFLFDNYQIYEARCHGADAILLIAAVLKPGLLAELIALATSLGMAALVEVHDELEIERALAAGAEIIGVNNRDLRTFQVTLETTDRLRHLVPADRILVSESGIANRSDVVKLEELGVNAVLVGEALVTAADPLEKIRELLG